MNYAYKRSIDVLHAAQAAAFTQNPRDAILLARLAVAVYASSDVSVAPGWYAYLMATQHYLEGDLASLLAILPQVIINADITDRLARGLLVYRNVNYARDFLDDNELTPMQRRGLTQHLFLAPTIAIVHLDCIQKTPIRPLSSHRSRKSLK